MESSLNKRPPTAAQAARIRKALEAKREADRAAAAAQEALKAVVVAVLKQGASHREVAAVAEAHDRTVLRWGHAGGWPTAEQKAEWAARSPEARRAELGLSEFYDLLERRSQLLDEDADTTPAD